MDLKMTLVPEHSIIHLVIDREWEGHTAPVLQLAGNGHRFKQDSLNNTTFLPKRAFHHNLMKRDILK